MSNVCGKYIFSAKPQKVIVSDDGKRMYDKLVSCFVCDEIITHKISDHMKKEHHDNAVVAEVLAIPRGQKSERIWAFKRLANMGAFKHNIKVLSGDIEGELIVVKRCNTENCNFLPCPWCCGFYQERDLWRHCAECKFVDSSTQKQGKSILATARLMLESALIKEDATLYQVQLDQVLSGMHKDEVRNAVKSDGIMCLYGATLMYSLGSQRSNDIRQRMRLLGKLSIQTGLSVDDMIKPGNFNKVVKAVEQRAGLFEQNKRFYFTVPSFALRAGHILFKCSRLKLTESLKTNDTVAQKEARAFQEVYDGEWTCRVSKIALATLKERKYNKPELLPLTQDTVKLEKFLTEQIKTLADEIIASSYQNWRRLLECTMTKLITFNKRRPGEVGKLLLEAYLNKPNWKEHMNLEVHSALNAFEKKLCERYILQLFLTII